MQTFGNPGAWQVPYGTFLLLSGCHGEAEADVPSVDGEARMHNSGAFSIVNSRCLGDLGGLSGLESAKLPPSVLPVTASIAG